MRKTFEPLSEDVSAEPGWSCQTEKLSNGMTRSGTVVPSRMPVATRISEATDAGRVTVATYSPLTPKEAASPSTKRSSVLVASGAALNAAVKPESARLSG
jgi:hypothetical protein